ncbi:MAG: DUF5612 domain-containing protein [Methanobacteriaceae archaeon]|nr:DUF5612 domain-containing protein [Methanobacteriaceae archaeon]
MKTIAITIKTVEKTGVLHQIAEKLAIKNFNIIYTHLFVEEDNTGTIYMEIEGVEDDHELINYVNSISDVTSVEFHKTLSDIYGKRVIVVGDGEFMAQAVKGGIMEAEKHNINGERISVDGMMIGGGTQIQEAIIAISRLPRVCALVLSGSMMGGKITNAITRLKESDKEIIVVTLQMPGDVLTASDVTVNDPVQAGAMAVRMVSDIDKLDVYNQII